ncbi:MAG: ABC transporter substrate-binding protein [Acidimicrobiia bacterium]
MTRTRSSWVRLLLLATVLALVAAACSSSETTETTAGGTDTTAGSSDTTAPGTDTSEPAAGDEKTVLQTVMSEEATDLNPLTTGQQGKGHVFQAIFNPLLMTDNEKNIISTILETWETSPDATMATLTLKEGVQWSDGTPMTAEDIRFSLQAYLNNNISNWAARIKGPVGQEEYVNGEADTIVGLRVIDDRTIEIDLVSSDAAWLPNLAALAEDLPILPSHVLGDLAPTELLESDYFRTFPVTSGPYKFVEFVEGQYVQLERNENWFGGTAYFEQVFMRIVSTDVMSAQLEAGEIDFMFAVDPADVERISSLPGIEVGSATGIAPELWSLMHDDGSLDVRVRQAMLFAIDRVSICQQAMAGYCSTPITNIRQIAPEWAIPTPEQYPDMIEYHYDPDRARELLAEAEADGAWDPNTELIFYHRPGRSYVDTAIAIAQAQMAEVGINWTIINTDTGGLIDAIREQPIGTLDGFWVSGADFTVDPSAVQTYTTCETARTGANLISYCRPELDELWAAGRATAVQEERQEIYHEAFRFLNQDPAEIYLYIVDAIVAYDERLKGIKPHGGVGSPFWNIGEWYWEE